MLTASAAATRRAWRWRPGFSRARDQRFGHIGGPEGGSSDRERFAGLQDRLRRAGLAQVGTERADSSFEGGCRAALALLARGRVGALICANDVKARGALTTARRAFGLRVPEDIPILGFEDIETAFRPCLWLTSVRNLSEEMAEQILQLRLDHIAEPTAPGKVVHMCPRFGERETH